MPGIELIAIFLIWELIIASLSLQGHALYENIAFVKILLLPDKFKGSLTAKEVIRGITGGILKVFPQAQITHAIVSDGGDGFLDAIENNIPVQSIDVATVDPLGRPITASFLFSELTKTAYVELAKASGLVLLSENERNPMQTSTYGTGLQMKAAIAMGAKKIYVGLGGSATNDAATGMAKALGYSFHDAGGGELEPNGKNLIAIESIAGKPDLSGVQCYAVNDVNNPLYGSDGAAYVYGAQKGATETQIEELDEGLRYLDSIVQEALKMNNADIPGAGAAGGAAYGLKSFCKAEFINGVEFILHLSGIDSILKKERFDMIITGEGKIDSQTFQGKLISGVLALGRKFDIPVLAVCGQADLEGSIASKLPVQEILVTSRKDKPLTYNMEHAAELLENRVVAFFERYK